MISWYINNKWCHIGKLIVYWITICGLISTNEGLEVKIPKSHFAIFTGEQNESLKLECKFGKLLNNINIYAIC